MFGFQARMTCAPGLSGLEPRLEQGNKLLCAASLAFRFVPLGVASTSPSTSWFAWLRAPLKPYLATAPCYSESEALHLLVGDF